MVNKNKEGEGIKQILAIKLNVKKDKISSHFLLTITVSTLLNAVVSYLLWTSMSHDNLMSLNFLVINAKYLIFSCWVFCPTMFYQISTFPRLSCSMLLDWPTFWSIQQTYCPLFKFKRTFFSHKTLVANLHFNHLAFMQSSSTPPLLHIEFYAFIILDVELAHQYILLRLHHFAPHWIHAIDMIFHLN